MSVNGKLIRIQHFDDRNLKLNPTFTTLLFQELSDKDKDSSMKHSDEYSADEATVEAGNEGHEVKRRNPQKYFAAVMSTLLSLRTSSL